MKPNFSILIATVFILCGNLPGDEVSLVFPKDATKDFDGHIPLEVVITRENGEIKLRLKNVSAKHLTITKHSHSSSGHYLAKDGSRLEEFGNIIPAVPKEFFDHVVLRPHKEKKKARAFSSYEVMKFSESRPDSAVFVFTSGFSGYFPTLDRYLEFTVSGTFDLKIKE